MGNYDQRKQEEERRLQDMLERINTLSLELSPPGPSTTAGSVTCVLLSSTVAHFPCNSPVHMNFIASFVAFFFSSFFSF